MVLGTGAGTGIARSWRVREGRERVYFVWKRTLAPYSSRVIVLKDIGGRACAEHRSNGRRGLRLLGPFVLRKTHNGSRICGIQLERAPLSDVLKSERAVSVSIQIIRVFTRMRKKIQGY